MSLFQCRKMVVHKGYFETKGSCDSLSQAFDTDKNRSFWIYPTRPSIFMYLKFLTTWKLQGQQGKFVNHYFLLNFIYSSHQDSLYFRVIQYSLVSIHHFEDMMWCNLFFSIIKFNFYFDNIHLGATVITILFVTQLHIKCRMEFCITLLAICWKDHKNLHDWSNQFYVDKKL